MQPTALESTTTSPTAAVSQITASKYCIFLNAVAATDSHHLYNEKIGSDLEGGCILRSGVVGSYSYSVIQEKEAVPITFLSWLDAMRYCNWLENASITSSEDIDVTAYGSYESNIKLSIFRATADLECALPSGYPDARRYQRFSAVSVSS